MPDTVEAVAFGLAGLGVADVGVQRVPVVGGLGGAVGARDRAERADDAGSGVTGTLGVITRAGGTMQATYDGHPLYTYAGDSGPGQAKGNGLNVSGGVWWEMTVSGVKPATSTSSNTSGNTSGGMSGNSGGGTSTGGGGYGY